MNSGSLVWANYRVGPFGPEGISDVISGSDLLLRSGTGSSSLRAEYHCGVLGEPRRPGAGVDSGVTVVTVVARQSTRCRGICDQPEGPEGESVMRSVAVICCRWQLQGRVSLLGTG
jgi:hypothetical protein